MKRFWILLAVLALLAATGVAQEASGTQGLTRPVWDAATARRHARFERVRKRHHRRRARRHRRHHKQAA
jgi:hypothetical protein